MDMCILFLSSLFGLNTHCAVDHLAVLLLGLLLPLDFVDTKMKIAVQLTGCVLRLVAKWL